MNKIEVFSSTVENTTKGITKGILESLPLTKEQLDKTFSAILFKIFSKVQSSKIEKENIEEALEKYSERVSNENLEELQQIPPELGVPVIEKLSYIQSNIIRSLYIEILIKSSIIRESNYVHPQLISIIPKLTEYDLKLINELSYSKYKSLMLINYQQKLDVGYKRCHYFSMIPKSFDVGDNLLSIEMLETAGLVRTSNTFIIDLEAETKEFIDFNFSKINSNHRFNFNNDYLIKKETDFYKEHLEYIDHDIVNISYKQYSLTTLGLFFLDFISDKTKLLLK